MRLAFAFLIHCIDNFWCCANGTFAGPRAKDYAFSNFALDPDISESVMYEMSGRDAGQPNPTPIHHPKRPA